MLHFCVSTGLTAAHHWSSGRIHRCHRCDPGSIPGWCIFDFRQLFCISRVTLYRGAFIYDLKGFVIVADHCVGIWSWQPQRISPYSCLRDSNGWNGSTKISLWDKYCDDGGWRFFESARWNLCTRRDVQSNSNSLCCKDTFKRYMNMCDMEFAFNLIWFRSWFCDSPMRFYFSLKSIAFPEGYLFWK